MARGVAPLVQGYAAFDRDARIAGIILNKVGSERQAGKLRQALDRYTDIPVLGAVGRDEGIVVRERHLGLTTPGETAECDAIVESARRAVAGGVDLARVRDVAAGAARLPPPFAPLERSRKGNVRIAVARDEAFGFYYQDDLEAFERVGATLVFFDALRDRRLPDCDGLFIGGGFPETHAARLAANTGMRESIRAGVENGLPTYAECGGLMYLSRSIAWGEARWPMVGAIPADARMHARPQGRGLVVLEETGKAPWSAGPGPIPAHEFHYAALEGLAPRAEFGYLVRRGTGIDGRRDGVVIGSLMASFSHLRNTVAHPWVERFVDYARFARSATSRAKAKTGFAAAGRAGARCRPGRAGVMRDLPIFVDMRERPAVVVGGGVVAARRAELLVRSGARVTTFARELSDEFLELRAQPNFRFKPRQPALKDFAGSALCFIATDDERLTEAARAMAKEAGALVNVADRPNISDFIMPSIVDRSPLVIAVSTGGASPILGRMLKARLETLIPAGYGRLADLMSGFRRRVAEAISDPTMRRRFWETVLEGPIAEAALASNEEAAGAHLEREIERWGAERPSPEGEVYLVGAGPGDPDLLTFRALRLMQKADVVLYDRLTDERVMNLVRREAERIYVGKRPDNHEVPQEEISALLVRLAKQGRRVLRLKGGDPFMFGRGGEEIETLAEHGVPFQVCPGVTAAIGASAYAGIPLTHRDHAQACVFVTGHGKDGRIDLDWPALLQPRQTVAIYMGLRNLEALTSEFIARGASPDLPAAIVDNATRPNQRVVVSTLGALAARARAAKLTGPSIIIIGTVVSLRGKLEWYAPQSADPARGAG